MREFEFRLEDKEDPEIPALVDTLWNYYGGKMPELRDALKRTLVEVGLPVPGESASGILLPGAIAAAAESAGGESKLWVPD